MVLILKEPQAWIKAKAEAATGGAGKAVGSIADLFRHPRWRRSTLVGICLGVAGMVGLWGIAFFSPELITTAFKNRPLQVQEVAQAGRTLRRLEIPGQPGHRPPQGQAVARGRPSSWNELRSGQEVPPATVQALVQDLNRLIQHDNLYDEAGLSIRGPQEAHAEPDPTVQKSGERQNIISLNRQLVEQLFPGAIRELQTDH